MPETRPDPRDAVFNTIGMEKGLGRRAGRASMAVLAAAVLRGMLQIGSIAIIARLIPPADYGVYAMALPAVMIGMALSNFGLPQAIVQHRTISHMHVSALFWLNLGLAVLVAGALFAIARPMAAFYGEDRVMPVLQAISLTLLFSATTGQYSAVLRRTLRIRQIEIMTLSAELLGLAVAVIAALNGLSYWALVLQQFVTPALKTFFMAAYCRWLPSGPQHVRFSDALGSARFGGYLAGASIMTQLAGYSGTLIAGAFFDTVGVGLFNRARNVAVLAPRRMTDPLGNVFVSTLSRLQEDDDGFRRMFMRLISRANLAILPLAVLVAAGAEPMVAVLLGSTWAEAAPLLFWLSIFSFRQGIAMGLHTALTSRGQSRTLFLFSIARLVLLSSAMTLGATLGSLLTMTIAYTLCEVFVTLPLLVAMAIRKTPLTFSTFMLASGFDVLLAFALAGALTFGLMPMLQGLPAMVQLTGLALAIALVYGARIGLSAELRSDVLRVLRNAVQRT